MKKTNYISTCKIAAAVYSNMTKAIAHIPKTAFVTDHISRISSSTPSPQLASSGEKHAT